VATQDLTNFTARRSPVRAQRGKRSQFSDREADDLAGTHESRQRVIVVTVPVVPWAWLLENARVLMDTDARASFDVLVHEFGQFADTHVSRPHRCRWPERIESPSPMRSQVRR
jgi:hypothetical protein